MQTAWLRVSNNTSLSAEEVGSTLDNVITSLKGHIAGRMDSYRSSGDDVCVRCLSLPDDISIYKLVEAFDASLKERGIKTDSRISSSEPPPMTMVSNKPVPQAIVSLSK